jgi:hypothetical protein
MADRHTDRTELALLVLKRLTAALTTCRLYGPAHPRTDTAVADLTTLTARYLGEHGALTVEVGRATWRFEFDGAERANNQVTPLLTALHSRRVHDLTFASGAGEPDLRALLDLLILPIDKVRLFGGAAAVLAAGGVRAVSVAEIAAAEAQNGAGGAAAAAILKLFVAAARSTRLYGEGHPAVRGTVDELFAGLAAAFASSPSVRYDVRAGSVFAGSVPVEADPLTAAAFASDCAARQIEHLAFERGLTRAELGSAVSLFASDPEAIVVEGGFPEALRVRQVAHVG